MQHFDSWGNAPDCIAIANTACCKYGAVRVLAYQEAARMGWCTLQSCTQAIYSNNGHTNMAFLLTSTVPTYMHLTYRLTCTCKDLAKQLLEIKSYVHLCPKARSTANLWRLNSTIALQLTARSWCKSSCLDTPSHDDKHPESVANPQAIGAQDIAESHHWLCWINSWWAGTFGGHVPKDGCKNSWKCYQYLTKSLKSMGTYK